LEKQPIVFSAKCNPEIAMQLREKFQQITGAYHMNKTHWNNVVCDGLKKDFIQNLINDSYQLVYQSLTKKIKSEIENE
jgi:predicted DNA-binding protein (MmcQ/YjbR family)